MRNNENKKRVSTYLQNNFMAEWKIEAFRKVQHTVRFVTVTVVETHDSMHLLGYRTKTSHGGEKKRVED